MDLLHLLLERYFDRQLGDQFSETSTFLPLFVALLSILYNFQNI